tara:strand:- start:195 stop:440 length:246 start_codon:yes stop_codon:yes gene_type:complete
MAKKKGKTKSSAARLRAQAKYNRKPAQKKRRAALNKENRKRGTYGNGDGKDVSHTKGNKTVLEKASTNRRRNGRNGKSKLK